MLWIRRRPGSLACSLLLLLLCVSPLPADTPPVEDWEGFVTLALAARTPQDFAAVESRLQQLRRSGVEWEPGNLRLVWSLVRLAQFYRVDNQWTQAARYQEQVLHLLEASFGPSDWVLLPSLDALAAIRQAEGKLSLARQTWERALGIVASTADSGHLLQVHILEQLAGIAVAQGNPQEAERHQRRVTEIQEQALMLETPGDAIILARQARRHLQAGHEALALPLFQLAKEILMESSGPYHSLRVEVLNSLAHILQKEGDYIQAVELLKSALAITENMRGGQHPDLLPLLQNLAICYQKTGKPGQSRPLLVRTLALVESLYGADHVKTAEALIALADNLRLENQPEPSVALYNRGAVLFRQRESIPGLVRALTGLARAQQMQGRHAAALRTLQDLLEILHKGRETEHPEVQAVQRFQAELAGEMAEKQQIRPAGFTHFNRQLQEMQSRLQGLGQGEPATESPRPLPLLP
ncbi:MAG: tetratricopeptide repeat protein [Magnetococcales bacterium]|nr:tetratricopeptide repeat protein [Magnetococcales bacterium]